MSDGLTDSIEVDFIHYIKWMAEGIKKGQECIG